MEITIIKNNYGSLFALHNGRALFQFEERGMDDFMGKGKWFFWPRGDYNPTKFTGKFPRTYFLNLCKAIVFITGDEQEMADTVFRLR